MCAAGDEAKMLFQRKASTIGGPGPSLGPRLPAQHCIGVPCVRYGDHFAGADIVVAPYFLKSLLPCKPLARHLAMH